MIYFDNAATTYPKPMAVTNAVRTALQKYGANPGRSGHKMSMAAAENTAAGSPRRIYFMEGPENVAFTLKLHPRYQYSIEGAFLKPGDHVVVFLLRAQCRHAALGGASPAKGVSYTQAQVVSRRQRRDSGWLSKALNAKTKLIVCMHASNVGNPSSYWRESRLWERNMEFRF